MGWWKDTTRDDPQLVGDESLDDLGVFMRKVAESYTRDHGRKPTLSEFLRLIEIGLASIGIECVQDLDSLAIERLIVETRRVKRQRPKVGDVFAIPLGDGRWTYGWLWRKDTPSGHLVDFFKLVATNHPPVEEILQSERLICMYISMTKLRAGIWPILGHVDSSGRVDEQPRFKSRLRYILTGEWVLTEGAFGKAIQSLSESEAMQVPDSAIHGADSVETIVRAKLRDSGLL